MNIVSNIYYIILKGRVTYDYDCGLVIVMTIFSQYNSVYQLKWTVQEWFANISSPLNFSILIVQ